MRELTPITFRKQLYDIEHNRWLHLEEANNEIRLYAWQSGDANDEEQQWHPIQFPPVLAVWDPEGSQAYHYFMKDETLYRYFQHPLHISPKQLNTDNDKQLAAIKRRVEAQNGFMTTDAQGQRLARGQKFECLKDGNWQPASFSILHSAGMNMGELLPEKITPSQAKPPLTANLDQNDWLAQRQQLPQFDESIETDAPKESHWQLDVLAKQCLEFKAQTATKEEYLQLLEVLMGNRKLADTLQENRHLPFVLQGLQFIRQAKRSLRDANDVTADQASLYLLRRIQQEYEQVAKHPLAFEIDVNNLPAAEETAADNPELDEATQIYGRLLNNGATLDDILNVYHRLTPNGLTQNAHNLVSHWLVVNEGGAEAASRFCVRALAKIVYPDLDDAELDDLQDADLATEDGQALALRYPLLFAVMDKDFAFTLLEKPDLLAKLSGNNLLLIARIYEDFVPTLLEKTSALAVLNRSQVCGIAMRDDNFAMALLEHPELAEKLLGEDLFEIADTRSNFALGLLKKPELASKLSSDHLYRLTRYRPGFFGFKGALLNAEIAVFQKLGDKEVYWLTIDDKSFAEALLERPHFLEKRSSELLQWITQKNAGLAMQLLQYPQLLEKKPDAMSWIAQTHESFALALFQHPNLLEKMPGAMTQIAQTHEAFALALFQHPELLEKLDSAQLLRIAKAHESFALALLQHPGLLEKLDDLQLVGLFDHKNFALAILKNCHPVLENPALLLIQAEEDEAFALTLLEYPSLLDKMNDYLIARVACKHENFALALLEGQESRLEKLKDVEICKIMKRHSSFALGLIKRLEILAILPHEELQLIATRHFDFENELLSTIDTIQDFIEKPDAMTFDALKESLICYMLAYNIQQKITSPNPPSEKDLFSQQCISTLSRSTTVGEIKESLGNEKSRIHEILPGVLKTAPIWHPHTTSLYLDRCIDKVEHTPLLTEENSDKADENSDNATADTAAAAPEA